jgi:hypothetical protein
MFFVTPGGKSCKWKHTKVPDFEPELKGQLLNSGKGSDSSVSDLVGSEKGSDGAGAVVLTDFER